MKTMHILKYFISVCLFIVTINAIAQEKDSTSYQSPYGLRFGIDISKPITKMIDSNSDGLEFVADYRITQSWYIATEIGYQKEKTIEDYTTSTSKGNFIKIGANYNAYENWSGMNNEIFIGFRYAMSTFDQILNEYAINTGSDYFTSNTITPLLTSTELNAHWTELVMGIKVETLKNLFLGFSFSYKVMLSLKHPDNFKTLYVPGFNRVFETETGFGFNYTISYRIPFVNK